MRARIFEVLEEIEAATCEILARAEEYADVASLEATRLASEAERIVARDLDRTPALVLDVLTLRRDRLRHLLHEGAG